VLSLRELYRPFGAPSYQELLSATTELYLGDLQYFAVWATVNPVGKYLHCSFNPCVNLGPYRRKLS